MVCLFAILKRTLKVVLILAFNRNRKGKGATGILIQIAQSKGYDNVADYLKALQTKKGTDEFDEEEDEEVVEGVLGSTFSLVFFFFFLSSKRAFSAVVIFWDTAMSSFL